MPLSVTGLVIARNEARDLPGCLQAWEGVCDDWIVVNDRSHDATPDTARRYGAQVLSTCMDPETGFGGLRNTGLEAVQTSHVLVIDADERPSGRLLDSIQAALQRNPDAAYRFSRHNYVFGTHMTHGRFTGEDWQIRLFPSTVRYEGRVHEQPILSPEVPILDLDGHVNHYTYRSIREYLTKMVRYARLYAQDHEPLSQEEIWRTVARHFVRQQSYKDGLSGLVTTIGDGLHDFLVRRYVHASQPRTKSKNIPRGTPVATS